MPPYNKDMPNPVGKRYHDVDWAEAVLRNVRSTPDHERGEKHLPIVLLTTPKGRLSRWSNTVRAALRDTTEKQIG